MNTENRHFLRRAFAAAMALVMLLGCAGCGEKEENPTRQEPTTMTTTATEEPTVSAEESADRARTVLSEIMNGYEGKIDSAEILKQAIDEEYAAAEKLRDEGVVTYIERNDLGIYVEFSSGEGMIVTAPVEGIMAGDSNEGFRVVCYRTFQFEEDDIYADNRERKLIIAPSETQQTARRVAESFSSYVLEEADCKDDWDISLYDVLNMKGASLIVWEGHGNSFEKTGPVLFLPISYIEVKNNPDFYLDCMQNRIGCSHDGEVYITPAFFEHYFGEQDFLNCIVVLGTCLSGQSPRLADAFLDRGALCVTANSDSVVKAQEYVYTREFLNSMIAGELSGPAYEIAKEEGKGFLGALTGADIFESFFDKTILNEWLLFGLDNAFLSEDYIYYVTTKRNLTNSIRYPLSGVLYEKNGEMFYDLSSEIITCCDETVESRLTLGVSPQLVEQLMPYDGYYVELTAYLAQTEDGNVVIGSADNISVGMKMYDTVKESDEASAKAYDNLFDFLGESLDVVKQYYGEPNSDMGFDGNADCLTYEYGNYQVQFRSYGEKGVAEIDLRLEETSPEVKVTPSVTTKMNHDEIWAGLPEFSCSTEANDYDNGEGMVHSTWLYGDSPKGNVSFHWSSTGFNKNDLTKGPCCVFLCKYQ